MNQAWVKIVNRHNTVNVCLYLDKSGYLYLFLDQAPTLIKFGFIKTSKYGGARPLPKQESGITVFYGRGGKEQNPPYWIPHMSQSSSRIKQDRLFNPI